MDRYARTLLMSVIACIFLCVWPCQKKSFTRTVRFKDEILLVNQRPFFFIGTDGIPSTVSDYKEHYFNTIYNWNWRKTAELAEEARESGLVLFPFQHAFKKNSLKKCKLAVKKLKDVENLIGFCVGDDLALEHVPVVQDMIQIVRDGLPGIPVAFDCVKESQPFYAKIGDLFGTYCYVLDQEINGSTYLKWLDKHFEHLHKNQFRWTWVQAHSPMWYTSKYYLGSRHKHAPSPYPDGEMIRWIAYQAVASGCKGILYYTHSFFRDDWSGMDRWAEVGIINAELNILGTYLAISAPGPRVRCKNEKILLRGRTFQKGTIIIAVLNGPGFNHHFGRAMVDREVILIDKLFAADSKAFVIGFPSIREIPLKVANKRTLLELKEIEIAAPIIITENDTIIEKMRSEIVRMRDDISRLSIKAAEGKIAKTRKVIDSMNNLGLPFNETKSFEKADKILRQAKIQKDTFNKIILANDTRRRLRGIQRRTWITYRNDPKLNKDGDIVDFYTIPKVFEKLQIKRKMDTLPNCLKDGNLSFEKGEKWPTKWKIKGTVKNSQHSDVQWSTLANRTGTKSMRFIGRRLAEWHVRQYSRVSAEMRSSEAIPVTKGDLVTGEVWVKIPYNFKKTSRGAVLNLVGFNNDGNMVKGWRFGSREDSLYKATEGWKRIRVLARVDSPEVTTVRVRLGVSGIGECFFDDVKITKWLAGKND